MDLKSLLQNKKNGLKPTKTILTNTLGERFEISGSVVKQLEIKVPPFVVDNKPNLRIHCILPGLFLSSQDPVYSTDILKDNRIKHILSLGIEPDIKFHGITYYFSEILDIPEFNLMTCLQECLKIIHKHRSENILVHCNAGISRSPTVVISYLMAAENISYDDAFNRVKIVSTDIRPNDGFVRQLKMIRPEDLATFLVKH